MLEKRTKRFALIFLLLSLLATWNLITPRKTRPDFLKTPSKNGQAPIRKVNIMLDIFTQNQHDQLFEQLRKFADKNAFPIRISPTDPSGERFLVVMQNVDIEVIGVDTGDPGLFFIGFYNTSEERPVPTWVIDELIIDLKRFIEEIPNTKFQVME